jgi:hypothetical protein
MGLKMEAIERDFPANDAEITLSARWVFVAPFLAVLPRCLRSLRGDERRGARSDDWFSESKYRSSF